MRQVAGAPTQHQHCAAQKGGRAELQVDIQLLQLLSIFLGKHPHPAAADWSRLIGDYPTHEAAIIDFAVGYATAGHISKTGLPTNWLLENS